MILYLAVNPNTLETFTLQKSTLMRELYILLILSFLVNGAMAQWMPQNSGYLIKLNSVFFINTDTGFCAGGLDNCGSGSGTVLKTTNGGADWINLTPKDNFPTLHSVYFNDAHTGYMVGFATIFKTRDGGSSWDSLFSMGGCRFLSTYFTDVASGFVVGYDEWFPVAGYILKTADGGTTWSNTEVMPQWSVYLPNAYNGYSVGFGTIYKTTDGGMTWTLNLSLEPSGETFTSVHFINEFEGHAVTDLGSIYRTSDGANNWSIQTKGIYLSSVYFPLPEIGYIVGDSGTILKTTDGGVIWENQSSGTTNDLTSIYFIDENIGYVVGDSGVVLKTTNGGLPVGIAYQPLTTESVMIYPVPVSTTITIETSTTPELNTFLTIYNMSGQQLIEHRISEAKTVFDLSGLPQGIYLVRVQDGKRVRVEKIVRQ
jgi:photosystem II stability/assembly factor-like uncharacterized protein